MWNENIRINKIYIKAAQKVMNRNIKIGFRDITLAQLMQIAWQQ